MPGDLIDLGLPGSAGPANGSGDPADPTVAASPDAAQQPPPAGEAAEPTPPALASETVHPIGVQQPPVRTDARAGDQIAQIANQILAGQVRHAATYFAGLLAGVGAINHDQQAQAVTLLSSIGIWAITAGWSALEKWWAKRHGVA